MRHLLITAALFGLAACATSVPDSNPRGAGFDSATEFAARQAEAERARAAAEAEAEASAPLAAPAPVTSGGIGASDLAAAGIGGAGNPATSSGMPLPPSTIGEPLDEPLPPPMPLPAPEANNPGISDEQDFSAVSTRETIESDAARLAQLRAQRQEVTPTALPDRPADTGPNIVQYALGAPNRKGQEWYSRIMIGLPGRFERNCAGFNSPDAAQREFLARGGPDKDPLGIDPDGDGFACGWDPEPFRLAAGG